MRTELYLVKEALAVGKAMGVQRVDLPGFSVRLFSQAIERLPVQLLVPPIARKMKSARGDKLPSLFYDLEDPSRGSEIDAMNGAIASQGEKLQVATPKNEALTYLFHRCREDHDLWLAIREQPRLLMDYV